MKRIIIISVLVLMSVTAFVFVSRGRIDFTDRSALLINVAPNFDATIEFEGRQMTAHLHGLPSVPSAKLTPSAKATIDLAMRDKIAFREEGDGTVIIWFETEDGAQSLNDLLKENSDNP